MPYDTSQYAAMTEIRNTIVDTNIAIDDLDISLTMIYEALTELTKAVQDVALAVRSLPEEWARIQS